MDRNLRFRINLRFRGIFENLVNINRFVYLVLVFKRVRDKIEIYFMMFLELIFF